MSVETKIAASNMYDAYVKGFGEIPEGDVPTQVIHTTPGLGIKESSPDDKRTVRQILADDPPFKLTLQDALLDTRVAQTVDTAHAHGHHVGIRWALNEIELVVAKHPRAIAATGLAALSTVAAAGVVYLLEQRKKI